MLQTTINTTVEAIMGRFVDFAPGNGYKLQALEAQVTKRQIPRQQFYTVVDLLLLNEYLDMPDDGRISYFVRLTEKGYALIRGEEQLILAVNFAELIEISKQPNEKIYYKLWDYIGDGDKTTNPFYVAGPQFYNACKKYLPALPPTYSQYLEDLEKATGKKLSRSVWCKELFLSIPKGDIKSILEELSMQVNGKIQLSASNSEEEPEMAELIESKDITMVKPKVFISHNEEDAPFAHALVGLMRDLGMQYEDIFCSSHPACAIPFGKSLLNTMRKQFDEFNLTVLFVHSPRLYASAASLCEMGAAWILRSNIFSFLTSDCSFDLLKGVVTKDDIAFKAGQDNTYRVLNDFRRFLEKEFKLAPISDSAWDYSKQKFIDTVSNIKYEGEE